MKIGVMTFWWSQDNYGQLLQCYALQKYLRNLGHDAFIIRYRMPLLTRLDLKGKLIKYGLHPWRILDGVKRVLSRRKGRAELTVHSRQFDEFRAKFLKFSDREYTSLAELRANPPEADMYIVGSDQVWRFDENFREEDIYAMLLDFGPEKVRRISYAASFGRSDFSDEEVSRMAPLLSKFDKISVRELSGLGVCDRAGIANAQVVCDPTFLLPAAEYLKIASPVMTEKKYVFCYMLTNDCDFEYPKLKAWAERKGLDVVYVTGNTNANSSFGDSKAQKSFLEIPEWLGLLANAEYVITNSFHCCVFAAHFQRRVGIIELRGSHFGMNARIASLDSLCKSPIIRVSDNDFEKIETSSPQGIDGQIHVGSDFLCSFV